MGWGSAPCLPLSISIHSLLLQIFIFIVLGPQFCCQFWHSESETKANSPILCKTSVNHHIDSQSKPEMLVLSLQGARKGPEEFIHLAFRLHLFLISENLVSLTVRKGIFQYTTIMFCQDPIKSTAVCFQLLFPNIGDSKKQIHRTKIQFNARFLALIGKAGFLHQPKASPSPVSEYFRSVQAQALCYKPAQIKHIFWGTGRLKVAQPSHLLLIFVGFSICVFPGKEISSLQALLFPNKMIYLCSQTTQNASINKKINS